MGETDKILKENLKKTQFALMVENGREKLQKEKIAKIDLLRQATAKPGKVINAKNPNVTLFTLETIEKYRAKNPKVKTSEVGTPEVVDEGR